MIDKLDVRVGWETPFSTQVARIVNETRGTKDYPFRPSQHYAEVGDLRPFDIPAVVHLGCKHGRAPVAGNHKIELLDTGQESYRGMLATMERIFSTDPMAFEVMRIDLAADVPGVGVDWFLERARAKYKQWGAKIGVENIPVQVSEMGKREIQTFYIGKRPNCYRFYNKIAEWEMQYRRLLRGVDDPPQFHEVYGHSRQETLTRVERQCGGGRIPVIATVADLTKAPDLNPFDKLEFLGGGKKSPSPYDYSFRNWCAGMFLRQRREQWGAQQFRSWVYQFEGRNTPRFLDQFRDFLPDDEAGVTEKELFGFYRESVAKQLAA